MKVHPVKVKEMVMSDIIPGQIFTLNGKKFIALGDMLSSHLFPAITLDAVSYVETTACEHNNIEGKVCVLGNIASNKLSTDGKIEACFPLCEHNIEAHLPYLRSHIKEDMFIYAHPIPEHGKYRYLNKYGEIKNGDVEKDKRQHKPKKLAINMFCGIRKDVVVYVQRKENNYV